MFRTSALVHCLLYSSVFCTVCNVSTVSIGNNCIAQKYNAKLVVSAVSGWWVGGSKSTLSDFQGMQVVRPCVLWAAQLSVIVKLELLIGEDRDTTYHTGCNALSHPQIKHENDVGWSKTRPDILPRWVQQQQPNAFREKEFLDAPPAPCLHLMAEWTALKAVLAWPAILGAMLYHNGNDWSDLVTSWKHSFWKPP